MVRDSMDAHLGEHGARAKQQECDIWESALVLIGEQAGRDRLLPADLAFLATADGRREGMAPFLQAEPHEDEVVSLSTPIDGINERLAEAGMRDSRDMLRSNPQENRKCTIMAILDVLISKFPAVRIEGLKARPEFNGQIGRVAPRADEYTDRYPVTLVDGTGIQVRVCNLRGARGVDGQRQRLEQHVQQLQNKLDELGANPPPATPILQGDEDPFGSSNPFPGMGEYIPPIGEANQRRLREDPQLAKLNERWWAYNEQMTNLKQSLRQAKRDLGIDVPFISDDRRNRG